MAAKQLDGNKVWKWPTYIQKSDEEQRLRLKYLKILDEVCPGHSQRDAKNKMDASSLEGLVLAEIRGLRRKIENQRKAILTLRKEKERLAQKRFPF